MDPQAWRRARLSLQMAAVFLPLAVFFLVYNRVVVDVNLHNLKLALRVLGRADAVSRAEAAMTLIDQNLLYSVASADSPPTEVAALQYARGVAAGDPGRLVEDAQAMVSMIVARRVEARGGFVDTLDELNGAVQGAVQRVLLMPRFLLRAEKLSDQIDLDRLTQAVQDERLGEFARAEALYQSLLRDYPAYTGRGDLQLRLGYLYHRQRLMASAERLYQQVLRQSPDPVEIGIARQLLARLRQAQRGAAQAAELSRRLGQTVEPAPRQQLAFDLGALRMQLFDLDGAIESFRVSAAAQPGTPLAAQALFRRAWCLKYLGRYDEALRAFQSLTRLAPGVPVTTLAYTQIADAYRATGQYEAAAESLEAAVGQAQDQALAAMLTAQVGSLYLLDLNQPDQADAYFRRVAERFPASAVSTIQQTIQQFQVAKRLSRVGPARAGAGTPVLGRLETAIPAFVEVFAERMAQYLRSTGETTHARVLTEQDFHRLVVRRVQERFPNQFSDIQMTIAPDGFHGSCAVRVGVLWFPVAGQARVPLTAGRPHVELAALRVGPIPIPEAIRQVLEARVNAAIDQARLPLRVERFVPTLGGVDVQVSLAE